MKLCGIKINKFNITLFFSALVYHVPQKNYWQAQAFHRGSQKGGKNSKYTAQVGTIKNIKSFIYIHNYN